MYQREKGGLCRLEKVSLEAWYARFHINGGKTDGDICPNSTK